MTKKILLSFASLFLLWQSSQLLLNIGQIKPQSFGAQVFTAWIINMFITGIFAFAGFAFATENLMPASYYTVKNTKRLERIFSFFGLELFRSFLLITIWRPGKQGKRFFDGKKKGIQHFNTQSKKSEFGHLWPFILLSCIGPYLIMKGMTALGIWTLIFNLFGNFYPIILQRHHRMRIQRLINKLPLARKE